MKKTVLMLLTLVIGGGFALGENQRTVYDSTYVFMEASGLSHVYGHKLVEMKSDRGCMMNNVIKLDYDPLSAYVEFQLVVVHRVNGKVDTLICGGKDDVKVYDYTAPARLIYWGAKQKMVEVGHLAVGDKLEYRTYRKGFTYALLAGDDEKYIPPMRGHFYDIVPFWSSEPIDLKVYRVNALTSKNLRYEVYNGKVKTETEKVKAGGSGSEFKVQGSEFKVQGSKFKVQGGESRTIYTFSKQGIKPIKGEQGMLARNDVECKLLLSTSADWEAKSVWFYNVNEDYGSFKATKELQRQVDILLVKAKDEEDTISTLTHWVADNMRYAGISMGKGEGYTLHNAEMNLTDRCGVCKDKAGLLVAMLRAAGFKAYAAMTMAGERIDRIPADQFNHSVCVVERRNGRYQLLDPTWVPNVRELWSSAEQQQGYLMGLPEGADLMETPISAPENHYLRISADTRLWSDGSLSGTITITAEGQSDAAVRRVFGRQADWYDALEAEMLKVCPQATVEYINHTRPEDYLKQPVKIVYKIEVPDFAVVSKGEAMFVPISLRNIFSRAMSHLRFDTKAKEKKYPFADACSRLVEISETMELPYEYKECRYAVPEKIENGTGKYEMAYSLHGKTFEIMETVGLNKRKYEAGEWETFRKIVENQKATAMKPMVLVK